MRKMIKSIGSISRYLNISHLSYLGYYKSFNTHKLANYTGGRIYCSFSLRNSDLKRLRSLNYGRSLITTSLDSRNISYKNENTLKYKSTDELLRELQIAKMNGNVDRFSKLLKENVTIRKFSHQFIDDLKILISSDWISVQNVRTLPRLIFNLGKYGFNCENVEHVVIYRNMIKASYSKRNTLTHLETAMIYTGCFNAKLKWSHLTIEEQSNLLFLCKNIITQLVGRNLSDILHSLGKMGVKWNELDSDLQPAIITRLTELHSEFTDQNRSMIIYSLGQLRFDIGKCKDKSVKQLLTDLSISTFNSKYDKQNAYFGQQQANTMFGLANMGFKYGNTNQSLTSAITTVLLNNIEHCNSVEFANIIQSLGKMAVQWHKLTYNVQQSINKTALLQLPSMNSQSLSSFIYGMGHMNTKWSSLLPNFQSTFETAFDRLHNSLTEHGLSNILCGLGMMKANWSLFTPSFYNTIETLLKRNYKETMNVTNIITGLDQMLMPWNNTCDEFLSRHFTLHRDNFNVYQFTCILLGMVNMNASWNTSSERVLQTVCYGIDKYSESIPNQNLTTVLYAIAVLTYDCIQPTHPLLVSLNNTLISLSVTRQFVDNIDGLQQLLVFYELHNTHPDVIKAMSVYSDKLTQMELKKNKLIGNADKRRQSHEKFNNHVLRHLQNQALHCTIKKEFYGLYSKILPVDCVVRHGDKIVAFIEIDGAHHYTADGVTLTREDQLMTYLYAQKYPDIPLLRVKNSDIREKGIKRPVTEIANAIVKFITIV